MSEKKSQGAKVIPFPGQAKTRPAASQTIVGSGNVGVVGDGNHVQITVQSPDKVMRPLPAPVPPPEDHITDEQASTLRRLHAEWVELCAAVKTKAKPITPQQAWLAINRAGKCTTYKHMRQANFDTACSYVHQQMAILRSGKTARNRDPKWRNSRISAIKARSANQLGNEFAYLPFIQKSFNAQSLIELDDEQLQSTYQHTLRLKPKPPVRGT